MNAKERKAAQVYKAILKGMPNYDQAKQVAYALWKQLPWWKTFLTKRRYEYLFLRVLGSVQDSRLQEVSINKDRSGLMLTLDFKQAKQILGLFGDDCDEISMDNWDETAPYGAGVYAWHTHDPGLGVFFLGNINPTEGCQH